MIEDDVPETGLHSILSMAEALLPRLTVLVECLDAYVGGEEHSKKRWVATDLARGAEAHVKGIIAQLTTTEEAP